MIISIEAIAWFVMGKAIDDKTLFKLARHREIVIEDDLRKSISNSNFTMSCKFIKSFFKKLFGVNSFHEKIDQIDFSSEIHLSSFVQNLEYIQDGYSSFFESARLESSFINLEINKIFITLLDFFAQVDKGMPVENLEEVLLKDGLFSQIDLKNDIYIDLGTSEVVHKKFSLNLLLYLCACLDVNDGESTDSIFQLIFERLLSDINELKSPFYYFVLFFRDFHSRNGKELSFEKISELLGIEPKSFTRYMKGERNVHMKHIDSLMNHGNLMYFYIAFWVRFLEKLSKTDETRFLLAESLNRYPQYFDVALSNFKKFEMDKI